MTVSIVVIASRAHDPYPDALVGEKKETQKIGDANEIMDMWNAS